MFTHNLNKKNKSNFTSAAQHNRKSRRNNNPEFLNGNLNIQAKLTIGQPNDKYEQEADRVADQVMRTPEDARPGGRMPANDTVQRSCSSCMEEENSLQTKPLYTQISPIIQRQTIEEEEEFIQTKKAESVTPELAPTISSGIQSLQGGGRPLSGSERTFFEPRFEADFSNVRVHNDTRAAYISRSVNARAFTSGQNVVFGAGEYSTGSLAGRKLLAHELTHVIQQKGQKSETLQRYNCPNSSSAATAGRSISGPIDWTVDYDEGDITRAHIDHTKDTSDITATAQLPGFLNNSSLFNYMGLTDVRFGHQINVRPPRRGRNTAVTVRPTVRYPRIFITRDFPSGSCHYNVVRDFEYATRHPVFLTSFLETIALDSDLTALSLPTTFGDIEQAVLDWCARTTASLEQGLAAAHPIHVSTIERNLANCLALSMVNCSQPDQAIITAARSAAQTWVAGTMQRLQNPDTAAVQELRNHFNIDTSTAASVSQVQTVRNNYTQLLAALNGNQLRFGCVNNGSGSCASSTTYGFASLGGFRVDFCAGTYQGMGVNSQTAGLIHEVHHASVPSSLGIVSEAYSHQSSYPLSANSSIHNPDSYAEFSKAVH